MIWHLRHSREIVTYSHLISVVTQSKAYLWHLGIAASKQHHLDLRALPPKLRALSQLTGRTRSIKGGASAGLSSGDHTMPLTATETIIANQELANLSFRTSTPLNNDVETSKSGQQEYKYVHLLPVFDPNEKYPPLELFEHVDPGHQALSDENPRSFLTDRHAVTVDLTPAIGTEIRGVNLLELSSNERDQLALEVARRGVLVFREQKQVTCFARRYTESDD
jgi:hypothetical protein